MKIRARERRDAFESNGTLVAQKKNKKRFKRKRKETTNTGPRLSRVVVGRATDRLSRPLFRFFFVFFSSPSLSYKRRFRMKDGHTVGPKAQKKGMDV